MAALQGKGRTINDLTKLKGENDFDTSGRDKVEYKPVSTSSMAYMGDSDVYIGAGIILAAIVFIALLK